MALLTSPPWYLNVLRHKNTDLNNVFCSLERFFEVIWTHYYWFSGGQNNMSGVSSHRDKQVDRGDHHQRAQASAGSRKQAVPKQIRAGAGGHLVLFRKSLCWRRRTFLIPQRGHLVTAKKKRKVKKELNYKL